MNGNPWWGGAVFDSFSLVDFKIQGNNASEYLGRAFRENRFGENRGRTQ